MSSVPTSPANGAHAPAPGEPRRRRMRLPVIDRYVLHEILVTWAAVTLVLLIILFTNSLAYMLSKVVEGDISGDVVLPLFLTNVASVVVMVIPLGLYLALLLTFGRLYAESEMAALGACGVGIARLYRPALAAGLIAAAITAALTIWVSPWATRVEHEVRSQIASRSDLTGVTPGRFNRAAGGDVVLFAEAKDGAQGTLQEVFVHAVDADGRTHVIRAERARQRIDEDAGARYLEFAHGHRYTGEAGHPQLRTVAFARHGIRLPERDRTAGEVGLEGQSMAELKDRGTLDATAERQWRVAMPVACVVLALMALPLSQTTPRKGRYANMVVALLVYIAYANVLVVARDALASGDLPSSLGLWWAHGLALMLAAGLIIRRTGWRWAWAVLRGRSGTRP